MKAGHKAYQGPKSNKVILGAYNFSKYALLGAILMFIFTKSIIQYRKTKGSQEFLQIWKEFYHIQMKML